MKLDLVPGLLVMGALVSCSGANSGNSAATPVPQAGPAVTAQTSPDQPQQSVAPAPQPNPAAPPIAAPMPTVAAPAINIPTTPPQPIGISGWWMTAKDATTAEDSAFNIKREQYACRAFTLINERQMKLANGWECWTSDNHEYFHIARLGTIVANTNNQLGYRVTGGCDTSSLNTIQAENFNKSSANGRDTLTLSSATSQNEQVFKITPGPTVGGWFVLPTATNWTVQVGCFDANSQFTTPSNLTADLLFNLSN